MTATESYIAGQKAWVEANGLKVGDTVRATRHFDSYEDGSTCCSSKGGPTKASFIDEHREGIVSDMSEDYIGVNHSMTFPYTVLEIVKKADGSVPDAKPITDTGEHDMSTQNFECKAVLTETADGGKETKTTVCFDNDIFEASAQEAKDTFLLDNAVKIKKAKTTGKVEVLVRPFCG